MSKNIRNSGLKYIEKIYNNRLKILYADNIMSADNFSEDVKKGLSAKRKFLLPKYFYDSKGSELFEKICRTKEYYPTRTEKFILRKYSDDISKYNPDINIIVELGSGSSVKTSFLLKSFLKTKPQINYIPVDVSDVIISGSENLIKKLKNLSVMGIISNYEEGLRIVAKKIKENKLIIFLGSSIGNLTILQAKTFLNILRKNMGENDLLLIGFDMLKNEKILTDAYNDRKKITAAFNLNILKRINRELKGDFNLNKFEHNAFFNKQKSRIEMHLVSKENQTVNIKSINLKIEFKKGETIHTENSYKFTDTLIKKIAGSAKLKTIKIWKDEKKYFSLVLFRKSKNINSLN